MATSLANSSTLCCASRFATRTPTIESIRPFLRTAYSTFTHRTSSSCHTSFLQHVCWQRTREQSAIAKRPWPTFRPLVSARSASTSSTITPAQLTWDEFLKLRRTRRYVNLVTSLCTAIGGIAVAVPIMAQYEVENTIASITGLDPFIGIGITITLIGGTGWLLGPFVGNQLFGIWKRSLRGEIARKEKDFYSHIKRYRADPTSSSVNNPVPDYYGEKIGSVAGYRSWLKDQRAFNRKKSKNML